MLLCICGWCGGICAILLMLIGFFPIIWRMVWAKVKSIFYSIRRMISGN